MRKRLTKMTLEQRPPKSGRLEIRDTDSKLVFRITANGARSFCVRTRIGGGGRPQQRLTYPKLATVENLADARLWAAQTVDACRQGTDPRVDAKAERERATKALWESVVDDYVARALKENRTADESRRIFEVYVTPEWRGRPIASIDRGDVAALLDKIEDRKIIFERRTYGGPVVCDRVLAQVRALMNWHATRDASFSTPIVPGMARTSPAERARDRVLSDEEIRALWTASGEVPVFGGIVRLLLLTGQRRDEVGHLRRSEIEGDLWTIPAERYKTDKALAVPLSAKAREVIEAQDQIDGSDFVFTTNGKTPFSGYSKYKTRLDAAMTDKLGGKLEPWRLHDLRRTARSLMSRAGIASHTAERVLGHKLTGVEGVYDRHSYTPEKRAALEALAALVDRIVNPPKADNVVALAR